MSLIGFITAKALSKQIKRLNGAENEQNTQKQNNHLLYIHQKKQHERQHQNTIIIGGIIALLIVALFAYLGSDFKNK